MGYIQYVPLSAAGGDCTMWDIIYAIVSCRRRLQSAGYSMRNCQLQEEIAVWDIVYTNVNCSRRLHSVGYNMLSCQLQEVIAQYGI